jgi:hypothetical protein
MMSANPLPRDPVDVVRQLDAETIRQRIVELDKERKALSVLLRAALRVRRDDPATGTGH